MFKPILSAVVCLCLIGLAHADSCDSFPCANGGSCGDNGSGGFVCTCALGFTGLLCESDINLCASSPCANGGLCYDHPSGYECICPSGTTGDRCETDIDGCVSAPCQNGGTCVDAPFSNTADNFTCVCVTGYTGTVCDQVTDYCESSPCTNGGTCNFGFNGYTCSCATGFNGTFCEIDENECASSPCTNGGMCVQNAGGFYCTCEPGYTGILCESLIDYCASSPCQNGGTCFSEYLSFYCACTFDYYTDTCSTNDQCLSPLPDYKCQNYGACTDGLNSTTCNCTGTGTVGSHCEIPYIPVEFNGTTTIITVETLGVTLIINGPIGNSTNFTIGVFVYDEYINKDFDPADPVPRTFDIVNNFFVVDPDNSTSFIPDGGSYPVFQTPMTIVLTIPSNLTADELSRSYVYIQPPGVDHFILVGKLQIHEESRRRDGSTTGSINITSPGLLNFVVYDGCIVLNNTDPNVNSCGTGINCTAVAQTYVCAECGSSPCLNGGVCSDGTSFHCACPEDFTGPQCETRVFGFARCRAEIYCPLSSMPTPASLSMTENGFSRSGFQQLDTGVQFGTLDVYSQGFNNGTTLSVVVDNTGGGSTQFSMTADELNHSCVFEVSSNGGAPQSVTEADVGMTYDGNCQLLVYARAAYLGEHSIPVS